MIYLFTFDATNVSSLKPFFTADEANWVLISSLTEKYLLQQQINKDGTIQEIILSSAYKAIPQTHFTI